MMRVLVAVSGCFVGVEGVVMPIVWGPTGDGGNYLEPRNDGNVAEKVKGRLMMDVVGGVMEIY